MKTEWDFAVDIFEPVATQHLEWHFYFPRRRIGENLWEKVPLSR